jgi:hypothetical protein
MDNKSSLDHSNYNQALYLKLELHSLTISLTTLDHRLKLFNKVSTKSHKQLQKKKKRQKTVNLPKPPQEIA